VPPPTAAAVGSVWACTPPNPNAGGASAEGPWSRSVGTYDITSKAGLDGENTWSQQLSIRLHGDIRTITCNFLANHPTGTYPIPSADDAYNYDSNPNTISAHSLRVQLPDNPTLPAEQS
jgi:hypothetical protein